MRVPLLLLLLLTQLPTVCPLLAKPLHNNINDDDDPPKVKRRAPVIPKEDGSHHFGHPDSLPVNFATKELLSPPPKPKKPLKIFVASLASAFAGGLPGFLAGFVQVMTTMWLRTIMNYQYRYGTPWLSALRTLFSEGGISRLYSGFPLAIILGPLSRFGSTFSLSFVSKLSTLLPSPLSQTTQTFISSLLYGFYRLTLMPLDTMKTVLQVDSINGFRSLLRKVRGGDFGVLWSGSWAVGLASVMGHFPWFFTFRKMEAWNWLENRKLLRRCVIGFCSSLISDIVTNGIKVVKTTKQAISAKHRCSYRDVVNVILGVDGWKGLFCRGLGVRILTNGVNSIVFVLAWRGIAEWIGEKKERMRNKQRGKA